jgi:hypothetical protein
MVTKRTWNKTSNINDMLNTVGFETSQRKLALFACAVSRGFLTYLKDPRFSELIEATSKFFDEILSTSKYSQILADADKAVADLYLKRAMQQIDGKRSKEEEIGFSLHRVMDLCIQDAIDGVRYLMWQEHGFSSVQLCTFLRDIVEDPFRPIHFQDSWRSPDVVSIAQTIYDEELFDRMPILADALMDANCHHERIIQHCKGDGPHVRGCWVLDLILGKE